MQGRREQLEDELKCILDPQIILTKNLGERNSLPLTQEEKNIRREEILMELRKLKEEEEMEIRR